MSYLEALDVVPECVRCAPDGAHMDEAACALLRSAGMTPADTTVVPYEFSPVARPSDARHLRCKPAGDGGTASLSRVSMR